MDAVDSNAETRLDYTYIGVYARMYMYMFIYKGETWGEEFTLACRRTFSCLWNEPSSFEGTWIDRALPLKGLITMENATVT